MQVIQLLDNEPNDVGGMTAADLKAKFDEGGEAVKEFINNILTAEADAAFATKAEVQSVVLGQIPDGTVTQEKLSTDIPPLLNSHDRRHTGAVLSLGVIFKTDDGYFVHLPRSAISRSVSLMVFSV